MSYLIAHIGHTHKYHEHIIWWKPHSIGYTICIDKAGLYDADEARDICRRINCIAVTKAHAEQLARSTPYYRMSDGSLNKMYDGGPHRPVPNSMDAWKALMAVRLGGCAHPSKPTPVGKRSLAIYLDATQESKS